MNLPSLPLGVARYGGYPKRNQLGEYVFVKYPRQVTRKIIEQSWRDGLPNAKHLKPGDWIAVAAWHSGYLLIGNAVIFKSEELCQYACDMWNLQSFTPQEVKDIIDFSHYNK